MGKTSSMALLAMKWAEDKTGGKCPFKMSQTTKEKRKKEKQKNNE